MLSREMLFRHLILVSYILLMLPALVVNSQLSADLTLTIRHEWIAISNSLRLWRTYLSSRLLIAIDFGRNLFPEVCVRDVRLLIQVQKLYKKPVRQKEYASPLSISQNRVKVEATHSTTDFVGEKFESVFSTETWWSPRQFSITNYLARRESLLES